MPSSVGLWFAGHAEAFIDNAALASGLHFKQAEATKGGKAVELSPRELELMRFFVEHRGEVVSREDLLDAVWGYDTIPFTRTVDTHVKRISGRLGLTDHTDPVKIEYDLMAIVPKRAWNTFGLQLIHFGRDVCLARKPICPDCPLRRMCPYPDKTEA